MRRRSTKTTTPSTSTTPSFAETVPVGAPLSITLEVANLSYETRQLMLMIDPGEGNVHKWMIVSEAQGQKFGVSGPERGQDLLAVDAALVLGEIKGNSSVHATLRLIPLRPGPLAIPNFRIVDSRSGKRYYCAHKLQAVATATTMVGSSSGHNLCHVLCSGSS